jgi:hypothetical protein
MGIYQSFGGSVLTLQGWIRQVLLVEFLISLAYVAGDLAMTYENFTRCSLNCDRNPVVNQLAILYGPLGVWLWFPFEMALYFLPGAIATWYCYKVITLGNNKAH